VPGLQPALSLLSAWSHTKVILFLKGMLSGLTIEKDNLKKLPALKAYLRSAYKIQWQIKIL
jgi:hypothetical protein